MNAVWADRLRRWYAVALIYSLFAMPIHPVSSQCGRCLVKLSMAYLESVTKVIGMYGSVRCSASSIADSSAIWFECFCPGILKARFLGWFSPIHIPHPLCAFSFPLFKHEPSVKMVMLSCMRLRPLVGACRRCAGVSDVLFGSRKILKHSDRLDRIVTVGSKRISPCRLWCV